MQKFVTTVKERIQRAVKDYRVCLENSFPRDIALLIHNYSVRMSNFEDVLYWNCTIQYGLRETIARWLLSLCKKEDECDYIRVWLASALYSFPPRSCNTTQEERCMQLLSQRGCSNATCSRFWCFMDYL